MGRSKLKQAIGSILKRMYEYPEVEIMAQTLKSVSSTGSYMEMVHVQYQVGGERKPKVTLDVEISRKNSSDGTTKESSA